MQHPRIHSLPWFGTAMEVKAGGPHGHPKQTDHSVTLRERRARAIRGKRPGGHDLLHGGRSLPECAARPGKTSELSLDDQWTSATHRQRTRRGITGARSFPAHGVPGAIKMLDDTQAELQKETALIEVVQLPKDGRLQIKLGETATSFKGTGLYRFQADSRELRVFGGSAEVRAGDRKLEAGRGRMVRLGSPPSSSKFNTKETDAFHDWAARRSFLLYTSSAKARRQITSWEATTSGWSWNRDFNMQLFSPIVAEEYRAALSRGAKEASEEQKRRQQQQPTPDELRFIQEQQRQAQQQGNKP